MSATLTYKRPPPRARMQASLLRLLAALFVGLCVQVSWVSQSVALDNFSFSPLSPPKPKFRLPKLGDITIWKSDMQAAKAAYRDRDYVGARKHLHKALKKGNFVAAWYLGHIHRLGLGVPIDRGKAFHFYRTVALEYDDAQVRPRIAMITVDSLTHVADGYRTGIKKGGVRRDYARAFRLYRTAAARGHPGAQYGLGSMYVRGQGVRRNVKVGRGWLRRSAQKLYTPALAELGELYWAGKSLERDRVFAVALYIVAVRTGNEVLFPQIFDRHDVLSTKLSDRQYKTAERLATGLLADRKRRAAKAPYRRPKGNPPRADRRGFNRARGGQGRGIGRR